MSASAHHRRVHHDPAFGWDPWINEHTRPSEPILERDKALLPTEKLTLGGALGVENSVDDAQISGGPFYGVDTIGSDIGLITPLVDHGYRLFGSYIGGYGGYSRLVSVLGNTPGVFLLSYTVDQSALTPAHAADVQPHAMSADQLPHWYDHVAVWSPGMDIPFPWTYTSASNMNACINALAGRTTVRISAHYGFGWHVCGPATCGWPQAAWTQCFDTGPGGENYDRCLGLLLPQPLAPPTPQELTSMDIATERNAQGQLHHFVIGAAGKRLWFCWQTGNAWSGGENGVRTAHLQPFASAPDGLTFSSVSAGRTGGDDLNVFAQLSDGRLQYCYQRKGEGAWSHNYGELDDFAPAPGAEHF